MDWDALTAALAACSPSPWRVETHEADVFAGPEDGFLIVADHVATTTEQAQANALLLAAAPMLARYALAGKAVMDARGATAFTEAMDAWDAMTRGGAR